MTPRRTSSEREAASARAILGEDLVLPALVPHSLPGVLVAIEGSDGAGKTTLIRRLERRLQDKELRVKRVRFPSNELRRSRLFRLWVREGHREPVSFLALQVMHMADRIQQCHEVIEPSLRDGAVVLADRYVVSGIAAVVGGNLGSGAWFPDLLAHLIQPDVGVYLQAPWQIRLDRVRRRAHERTAAFRPEHKSSTISARVADALGMTSLDTAALTRSSITDTVFQLTVAAAERK